MEINKRKRTQDQAPNRQAFFFVGLLWAFSAWLQPAMSAESERLVSLTVDERAGVSRRSEPVTAGVPLPKELSRMQRRLRLSMSKDARYVHRSRWPAGGWEMAA